MSGSIGHKAKEIFVCPLCQVENRATAKFCRKCGKTRTELDSVGKRDEVTAPVSATAPNGAGEPLAFVYAGPPPIEPETHNAVVPLSHHEGAAVGENDAVAAAESDFENATQPDSENVTHLMTERAAQSNPDHVSPQCPSCHTGLRATDKFCSWCGEFQPNRYNPYLKVCPGCDQSLPHRANYCFGCGRDVGVHPRIPIRVPVELFNEEDSEFFPTFDA